MSRYKTSIDFDLSRSARPYRGKADLWKHDRARLLKLLKKQLDLVSASAPRRSERDSDDDGREDSRNQDRRQGESDRRADGPSLAIAIFGPSGSGKSSFLHTLVDTINYPPRNSQKREDHAEREEYEILGKDWSRVHALPVIDPANFAEDDDFLYAVLAAALEESERLEDRNGRQDDYESLSEVKREFNELSKYLHVIDKAPQTGDYDPLGTSLERLERHTSSLRLRSRFKKLIAALARSLNIGRKSLIILPVDDADLSVDRLVPTLKSYRTYLQHPQLVPVFSFTDRMAEEVLRVRYLTNIFGQLKGELSVETQEKPLGLDRLDIGRQLALQFLANCFPVRNRIRLGPAPAYVQAARYEVREADGGESSEGSVLTLLLTASFLLYGHPDRDTSHDVRSVLRPSTLRRQLQVADAMSEAQLEFYITDQFSEIAELGGRPRTDENGKPDAGSSSVHRSSKRESWVLYFNRAAWSLFNVHRDVLREHDLYLEELYSWTRMQLRRVVLDTLLAQSRSKRQALLQRWRSRSDERRSQVISLLAAEVFRPWMESEDPVGDVQQAIQAIGTKPSSEDPRTIRITQGIVWFLNLVIGFYKPQVLARNRRSDHRLSGIGWDLRYGPISAIRAADSNQQIFSTGMMFVDPESYAAGINWIDETGPQGPEEADAKKAREEARKKVSSDVLLLRLWSSYGYRRGRFWSVASLWRGLGLIGRLLEMRDTWPEPGSKHSKRVEKKWRLRLGSRVSRMEKRLQNALKEVGHATNPPDDPEDQATPAEKLAARLSRLHELEHDDKTERLKDEIERLCTNYQDFEEAKNGLGKCGKPDKDLYRFDILKEIQGIISTHSVSGMVPRSFLGQQQEEESLHVAFRTWDTEEHKSSIAALAERIYDDWLEKLGDQSIKMMPNQDERIHWPDSFMRRLHGDYIVGDLMPRLNLAFVEAPKTGEVLAAEELYDHWGFRSNAWIVLERWARMLLVYWEGCNEVFDCLKECPIFKPFRKLPGDNKLGSVLDIPYELLLKLRMRFPAEGEEIDRNSFNTWARKNEWRKKTVGELKTYLKKIQGDPEDLDPSRRGRRKKIQEKRRQAVEDKIKSLKRLKYESLKDRDPLDRAMQIRLFCEVLRVSWTEFKEPAPDPHQIQAKHDPIEVNLPAIEPENPSARSEPAPEKAEEKPQDTDDGK